MKLIRSWPAEIPEGRSYVMDDIPKLVMSGFDYRCLVDVDDDVCLIEWDIAVGGEQLATFMARAVAEPDRVRVAPYLLYRGGRRGGRHGTTQIPYYVHRVVSQTQKRWARPDDTHCQMFGFGLTYLPARFVRGFADHLKPHNQFTDSTFSRWHMLTAPNRNVPIDWDCHAIHLHYETPGVPDVA